MGFMKMCHSSGLLVRGFFIGCHSFHCLTFPRSSRQSANSGAAANGVTHRTVNRVEGVRYTTIQDPSLGAVSLLFHILFLFFRYFLKLGKQPADQPAYISTGYDPRIF